MLTDTYTAYGTDNKIIKIGTVTYAEGSSDEEQVMNWCEAVRDDVGGDIFDKEVVGIRE